MQVETAICATCRCGWIAVADDVKRAMQLLDEHVKWETPGPVEHSGRSMSISNPINPMATVFLRQQAKMYADVNPHSLSTLYRTPNPTRIVAEPKKFNLFHRFMQALFL